MIGSKFPTLHTESLVNKHPSLTLMHGWGQSMQDLKPLGKRLQNVRSVHMLDLPGFGKSPPPQEPCEIVDYAHILKHYLDKHEIEKTDLLGHSFGGKIALFFTLYYPERVNKLILIGASALKRKRSLQEKLKLASLKWTGKGIKGVDKLLKTNCFQTLFAPRFGSTDYKQATGVMRTILIKSINLDLSEHLQKVFTPTLLLWGEEDYETPLEIAQRMQKAMPNCQLISFPQKGHYFMKGVGSHLAARYLLPFLED